MARSRAEYDAVVVELKDTVLAESVVYAVIDKIPWQTVIVIGSRSLLNVTCCVVPSLLGAIA